MQSKITFDRDGLTLVGTLCTPADFDEAGRYQAIIVQGSLSSVKEMMPATYATKLADHGFVVLAFDYAHYGESEGMPRQLEDPAEKLLDLEAAVTYLLGLPYVEAVGMVGICTSASNGTQLVAKDTRVKAFATIAAALFTPAGQLAAQGGEEGVKQRLADAAEASKKYSETGEQTLVPVYSEADREAVNFRPVEGAYDYYTNPERGNVPNYTNQFDVQSWPAFLAFDGVSPAPSIKVPTMVVHSDQSAAPDMAKAYFESLTCEKELVWGDGNHWDYYDSTAQIDNAVANVARFFRSHLTAA